MPRATVKRHVLHDLTVAANERMRGHAEPGDSGKERIRVRRQRVGEERVYPGTPELTGRQTDAVYHHEIDDRRRRPLVAVGGFHLAAPASNPVVASMSRPLVVPGARVCLRIRA